jgi:hypothetical protein
MQRAQENLRAPDVPPPFPGGSHPPSKLGKGQGYLTPHTRVKFLKILTQKLLL